MPVQAFGAFLILESDPMSNLTGPAPVVHKDSITSVPPTEYKLNELQCGERINGPGRASSRAELPMEQTILPTPSELERSQPSTPTRDHAVDAIVHSFSNPPRNRWRIYSACVMFLLMGMNDAATGALV